MSIKKDIERKREELAITQQQVALGERSPFEAKAIKAQIVALIKQARLATCPHVKYDGSFYCSRPGCHNNADRFVGRQG